MKNLKLPLFLGIVYLFCFFTTGCTEESSLEDNPTANSDPKKEKSYFVKTFAGTGEKGSTDGCQCSGTFMEPNFIGISKDGIFYITDGQYTNKIRMINPKKKQLKTVVTGPEYLSTIPKVGTEVYYPQAIAASEDGTLYIIDQDRPEIIKITKDGTRTLIGGGENGTKDGPVEDAKFYQPRDLEFGPDGSLYISDLQYDQIRKISPDGTTITTVISHLPYADHIAVGHDGSIYVAASNTIFKVTSDGVQSVYAKRIGMLAKGLALDSKENLYVVDFFNHKILKILPDGTITDFAGSGRAAQNFPTYSSPDGLAEDFSFSPLLINIAIYNDVLYFAQRQELKIRMIDLK